MLRTITLVRSHRLLLVDTLERQLSHRSKRTSIRNRHHPPPGSMLTSKLDKMMLNIENEQLLDVTSQQEELIRAKDIARRQASIDEQERKATEWRSVDRGIGGQ